MWEVERMFIESGEDSDWQRLNELLQQGWEPFTVTLPSTSDSVPGYVYHLKRKVEG